MGLYESALDAVGDTPDLRIGQALEIVRGYGEALAPGPGAQDVRDESRLPYPKDTLKWALLLLLAACRDEAKREPLKAAFVSLADWQDLARFESQAFDSARLRRKLDPLALAREFAAHATPASRAREAVRAEQAALIAELRRRGLW